MNRFLFQLTSMSRKPKLPPVALRHLARMLDFQKVDFTFSWVPSSINEVFFGELGTTDLGQVETRVFSSVEASAITVTATQDEAGFITLLCQVPVTGLKEEENFTSVLMVPEASDPMAYTMYGTTSRYASLDLIQYSLRDHAPLKGFKLTGLFVDDGDLLGESSQIHDMRFSSAQVRAFAAKKS